MKNRGLVAVLSFLTTMPVLTGVFAAEPSPSPVLIELFSSQGCSSCPPAEELLNSWGMEHFQKGEILPLAFHVDYWNYLGWPDPFSSAIFTDRQREYASVLHSSSLYTPQMIVSGQVGFVGSDAGRAAKEVAVYQTSKSPSDLHLKIRPHHQKIALEIDLASLPSDFSWDSNRLWVVVFENGMVTKVERGENGGKTLEENFVVRSMNEVKLPSSGRKPVIKTVIPWDQGWDKTKSGIAVFLQDSSTMKINGLKWIYPAS